MVFQHLYWAKVTDNIDPDGLNRIMAAKIGEEDIVTNWIPVTTPFATHEAGFSFIPNVGDQVLVASMGMGDMQKVAIGSTWNNEAAPPETGENAGADLNKDGKNALRFFKSATGGMLVFDDTEGAEKLQIISAGAKTRLEFSDADEQVSMVSEHDLTFGAEKEVSIEAEEVSIESEKQFSISADQFHSEAEQGWKTDAGKGIDIKGSSVGIN